MRIARTILGLAVMVFGVNAGAQDNPTQTPAAPAVAPSPAQVDQAAANPSWTFERYTELVQATGRKMTMTQGTFDAVQKRRDTALSRIENYLAGKFGEADKDVMAAFAALPREYFHYNYEGNYSTAGSAYEADAKPWGVGYGSALSDYLGQAYMTQLSKPKSTDVVLEIGTGSGFQSALLAKIVKEAYTIEIIEPLGKAVDAALKAGGYTNVQQRVGDGFFGWPEVQGGFDIIMVTCAAQYVPPALIEQLKPGGRLIIPVGPAMKGKQTLFVYSKDEQGKVHSKRDVGVYFIPMVGAIQKTPKSTPQANNAGTPAKEKTAG
jgi:protein-L-isoaspartate(D-aspartate) O-methyltransferase